MQDFLIDSESGDIQFLNGDLAIGFSDYQHQEDLLLFEKGSVKEFPTVGAGIGSYLNDGEISEMLREVRGQFEGDGMTVNLLNYDEVNGKLTYDAAYR